jgi:hypothetical protein
LGAEHLASEHLASEHLATEHLASERNLGDSRHRSSREHSLETCPRMMICLSSRRFVIVQPEGPQRDLWPVNGGWEKIRNLQAGDEVVYRGCLATVRAVEAF